MAQKKTPTNNPGSNMDLAEIKAIVDLMAKNEISFFQLEREGANIQLRRGHDIDALKDLLSSLPAGFGGSSQPQVVYGGAQQPQLAAPAAGSSSASAPAAPAAAKEEPTGPAINSPMVGTFYRAAAPGEKNFISVGDHVEANTTVCIIEAMKVMNEIKAETSGTIARVIAEDGKPVQYGQALFQLK
ncbi:MAG: accB [Verrucomicrobiaceae bacterium]|nr:accB [Verrucomicrobiaceae bacterium]MDB6119990.1 accB [Verrucomicrobiaceae bacterium]